MGFLGFSSAVPQKGGLAIKAGPEQLIVKMSKVEINVADYKIHESDTGSADYQIAVLSKRINHLTEHLGRNKKDVSSRRGLLGLVARRRKLLDYLKATEEERYQKAIKGLGIRR